MPELLAQMPPFRVVPLVGPSDLRELTVLIPHLQNLTYPINSAAELIDQLGGGEAVFEVFDVKVQPMRMVKYMPAYYFPVASVENLVEKLAELIRANRKTVDVVAELDSLRKQLPVDMKFPIENADELVVQLRRHRSFRFQGVPYKPADVVHRIPERKYPLRDREHFEQVIAELMVSRRLITGH
jgi:hypothetical protein